MSNHEQFSKLQAEFEEALICLEPFELGGFSFYAGCGPVARGSKRIELGDICIPTEHAGEVIDLAVYSIAVNSKEPHDRSGVIFAELAKKAGAALQATPIAAQLRSNCQLSVTPAPYWFALLWNYLGGGVLISPKEDPANRSDDHPKVHIPPHCGIVRPFHLSIEVISQCGLDSPAPVLRTRENLAIADHSGRVDDGLIETYRATWRDEAGTRTMEAEPPQAVDTASDNCQVEWLGANAFRVDRGEPKAVTDSESCVLQAFIGTPAMNGPVSWGSLGWRMPPACCAHSEGSTTACSPMSSHFPEHGTVADTE